MKLLYHKNLDGGGKVYNNFNKLGGKAVIGEKKYAKDIDITAVIGFSSNGGTGVGVCR